MTYLYYMIILTVISGSYAMMTDDADVCFACAIFSS